MNVRLRTWIVSLVPVVPAFFVGLSCSCSALGQVKHSSQNMTPTYNADQIWRSVLSALDERHGPMTKLRFEKLFGVQLVLARSESDSVTYVFGQRQEEGSALNARLTIFHDNFKSVAEPALNGAHLQWYFGWEKANFSGACVTAEHVKTSLLAEGWTSPWSDWGAWERNRTESSHFEGTYPPITAAPTASFHRKTNRPGQITNAFPRGQIDSSGDFADSCVTGILVDAAG